MGLKATVKGEFLEATELKPWEFNGNSGKSFTISILQESDSIRMSADQKHYEEVMKLKRMESVVLECDLFRDRETGLYKPKVVSIQRESVKTS